MSTHAPNITATHSETMSIAVAGLSLEDVCVECAALPRSGDAGVPMGSWAATTVGIVETWDARLMPSPGGWSGCPTVCMTNTPSARTTTSSRCP